jgi:AraC-like DNA-binding protein
MRFPVVNLFAAELWSEAGPAVRSRELTPLYVERFVGPHRTAQLTRHDFWELLFVFAGRGQMLGRHPFPLTAGTACLIPPGAPHIENSDDTLDLLWIGLNGLRVESLDRTAPHIARGSGAKAWCELLWQCSQRRYGLVGPELDGLTLVTVNTVLRESSTGHAPAGDRIDAAAAHIAGQYQTDLPIPDLAKRFGCSQGHFFREFKRRTGKTPVQYITMVRLQHAVRWLENSDLPVERVARLTGFSDPRYFCRVFRKTYGRPPSQWKGASGT